MAQNFGKNASLNKQLAKATGYGGDFGSGGYSNWLKGQGSDVQSRSNSIINNGVKPVGLVEPLNNWQRGTLSQMATSGPTQGQVNTATQGVMGGLNKAQNAMSPDAVQSAMNPYMDQVIGRFGENAIKMRERMNPELNSAANEMGAFGSTRDALQRSLSDEYAQSSYDDKVASLLAGGYDTAVGNNFRQAGLESQLAGNALGLFNNQQDRALYAGDRVQNQNQTLVDAARREQLAQSGYGRDMLNWYAGILGGIPTSSGQAPQTQQVNPVQSALGGGLLGYQLYNSMGGGAPAAPSTGDRAFSWAG